MMYFPSTKNRLKLKKLDKNCIQSIISKENRWIVIFWGLECGIFGTFCFTETIISHWKLFFLFLCLVKWSDKKLTDRQNLLVWWTRGVLRRNIFMTILLGSRKGCAGEREKPLVAGEERMLCSLLESKSPLRSVCQLQRLNWIWKCLHGEKQLIYVSREVYIDRNV